MSVFRPLPDAIRETVHDGDVVALEGFTHLIPFAAGHEIIRQQRRDLTLMRMTPDLIYDQMIGAGCAAQAGVLLGRQPRRRVTAPAARRGRARLAAAARRSRSTATRAMAARLRAGRRRHAVRHLRGYMGTTAEVNPTIRTVICPFTGETLAAVPALRPDVTIIHAQKADREGNVLIEGIIGVQKEAVLAAQARRRHGRGDRGRPSTRAARTPWSCRAGPSPRSRWCPAARCPSYAHGYYARDNAFYTRGTRSRATRERVHARGSTQHVMQAGLAGGRAKRA